MEFKKGDVVIYEFDVFVYRLKLLDQHDDESWEAIFLKDISGWSIYKLDEKSRYPFRHMKLASKLEQLIYG